MAQGFHLYVYLSLSMCKNKARGYPELLRRYPNPILATLFCQSIVDTSQVLIILIEEVMRFLKIE